MKNELKIGVTTVPVTADAIAYVREAERLGVDSAWVPEFWGYDAFSPIAALAMVTETITLGTAIVQIGTRTPAMMAMTARTLHELSAGRFVLGLGTSGPQVMEGWHGIPFAKPITRTRETIEIIRAVLSGEKVSYDGVVHQLPLPGGQGRSLRMAASPAEVPIYVASLGPANLKLTGEMAQGWIGNSFFAETASVFFDEIEAGATGVGRSLADVDLTVSVSLEFTEDDEAVIAEAGQRHASGYAFTFGAMGSGSKNFYNNAFGRQGYADDVAEVQRLWASGDRDAARARVPAAIGFGTNLIGPPRMIAERLREYRDAGVNTLRVNPVGETLDDQVDNLGRLMDIANNL